MTPVRGTYRVQLHKNFPVERARALLPYLEKLGISDLYTSPPFQARAGSNHGYDVTDPSRVNPEIGGEEQFLELAADLRARGMGLLVDIVPNHMAATSENAWWMDVLEKGPESAYADVFDIAWGSPANGSQEKIFLPILGDPFGTALENRNIRLGIDERGFAINYYSTRLPVDPNTYGFILEDIPVARENLWRAYSSDADVRSRIDARLELLNGREGDPSSVDQLELLLNMQRYRLAWWQNARELINYRRFFDVSDLIGVRQEIPEVFAATHRKICEWVSERDGQRAQGGSCRRFVETARIPGPAGERVRNAPLHRSGENPAGR